jgi:hypothetical protein
VNVRRALVAILLLALAAAPVSAAAQVESSASRAFEPAGELAEARAFHAARALDDGRVLVIGGVGRGYLGSTELWSPTAS